MDNFIFIEALLLAVALHVFGHDLSCFTNVPEKPCHMGYRWRFIDGECVLKSVCALNGANKFLTKTHCLQHCDPRNECVSPEIELMCADGQRWRFDPDTGDCKKRMVCGLTGQNKFLTRTACLQQCNPTNNCVTPQREKQCPNGYMWRFNPDTRFCNYKRVCSLQGQNKFKKVSDCLAACNPRAPNEDCVSPPFETLCYAGKRWRFDLKTGECKLRAVCNLDGPNTFLTKAACLAKCANVDLDKMCSAPAIHPAMKCREHYAWRYNARKRQCEHVVVCPHTGPNKYESLWDCINSCQACTAPATFPNVVCKRVVYAWRFDGAKCELTKVCPGEGANRYSTKEECEQACMVCIVKPGFVDCGGIPDIFTLRPPKTLLTLPPKTLFTLPPKTLFTLPPKTLFTLPPKTIFPPRFTIPPKVTLPIVTNKVPPHDIVIIPPKVPGHLTLADDKPREPLTASRLRRKTSLIVLPKESS